MSKKSIIIMDKRQKQMQLRLKQKQMGLWLRIRYCARGAGEGADKSSSYDVSVTCDDLRFFLSSVLELN